MIAVPLGVVGIVLLLVVPIPAGLLDVLIIVNILLSLVILLTSMFVKKPLDFSVFPSMLLIATLFRLGLNVASTRLVLGDGYAGEVIGAFGHIVVDGNLVIGMVVFLILVVIQFLVITKGAERVAEVGARFTLDAMPGKQMAIDADLNAGLISETDARTRRAEISAEADFYGAMDGASKFVKGDAIAGIVITLINLVGGIVVGVVMHSMPVMESIDTYSILTVGDGLVTQVPALLMAVATGMIVTRSNAGEGDVGSQASKQLVQSQQAVAIAGASALVMALIEGMPKLPFILLGIGLLVAAQQIRAGQKRAEAARAEAARAEASASASPENTDDLLEQMRVHALEILLAPDLVDLVTGAHDDLLGRVRALRRKIALDLGVVVPPVRTRDSIELPASTYAVRIAGVEAGRGRAPAGKVLALGDALGSLPGQATVDPVFGMDGKWVPVEMRHSAEMAGATVIDRVSVLVTHLSAIISANAGRLLSREDVRVLTEEIKRHSPSAVDELTPSLLSLAEIQRVLQGLLDEQVAVNDLPRIYEALALAAKRSTDPEYLVEAARAALGPAVPARHTVDGTLTVVTIAPALEQAMLAGRQTGGEHGTSILLDPARLDAFRTSVADQAAAARTAGHDVVLVCAPSLRPAVQRLVATQVPDLPVLSYTEATAGHALIETVGVVNDAPAIAGRG
ncbi:flagellar biosynthesis protein FlhA [Isoptericola sp. NEAU-Y5]|uniref:Flagellar biosynthesis protein FlhA n=1 Tax=Isoptericola luteus TaxID=2879484 RepID=A0ABS7ZL79_9MICO|nr:flagellar biosynthesis protein FlhA [Isoptericola sp. NEAU-Y5]MCA5895116.1 flagellar biosynthesis protein FlhA [Isoptericola sp. NEAU-Y5]